MESRLRSPPSSSSTPSNYSALCAEVEAFDRVLADARMALLQRGKSDVYDCCAKTIADIRELLSRHPSLATDHRGIRDRVSWRLAAIRLSVLVEELQRRMMLLTITMSSPIPDGPTVVEAAEVVYGANRDVSQVWDGSLGQGRDGEAVYTIGGIIGHELQGVVVHEMEGTLGHELDGRGISGTDRILDSDQGPLEVHEMSGTTCLQLDSVAIHELSGSMEFQSTQEAEAPPTCALSNGISPWSSYRRESTGSQVRLLGRPDSLAVGPTDVTDHPDGVSTAARSTQASPISRGSLSSRGSSSASTDRKRVSTAKKAKIDKGDNGVATVLRLIKAKPSKSDTGVATVLRLIKGDVRGFQGDQGSANRALIELSKHDPCEPDQIAAMRVLLGQCAADVECRDEQYGRTPLIWAVSVGQEDKVRILLDYGAVIEARDGIEHSTPLIWAACHGHEAVARLLIRRGASLEATDRFWRRTPLLWAAKRGAFRVAELLLAEIRDPDLIDARDKDGKTALAHACLERHPLTARALLDHDADPNFTFQSGRPLLVSAIMGGDEELVRLLVARNADVRCRNLDRIPALSIAVYDKPFTLVQFLVDSGADLEAADPEGCTPLIWAIKQRRENVVELLVRRGANAHVVDSEGRTAQHWARDTQNEKIICLVCWGV